jgi:hypothetical protein
VSVDLSSVCPTDARWSIVTVAYRKVLAGSVHVDGRTTVAWDLRDDKGRPVAGGLYYFLLTDATGTKTRVSILVMR